MLIPFSVHAGFFSAFFHAISPSIPTTNASNSTLNSQTLRVLEPAVNIDPNPAKGGGDITVEGGVALLPESGPSGTSADLIDRPASSQISVYVVREGDTVSQIAEMFDVSRNTVIWANEIKNGVIRPGQTLVILPVTGVRYTVKKGDTLKTIAKKYKADIEEVAQYNDLSIDSDLAVGNVVIIPDGEIAPTVPTTVKTAVKTTTNPLRGVSSAAFSGGTFIWPVDGGLKTQGLHGYNGIDIGASKGTAVYAAADGVVIIARTSGWNGGYGNYVVISHANGVQTLYGHLNEVTISAGDSITQGTVIGTVGATGKATGNHLHFEVRGAKNPF